jgi:superfamily II DNA or RNA helicase
VLISKVGDHSIDLPEANVVIQVGVVDGSRMQGSSVHSCALLPQA